MTSLSEEIIKGNFEHFLEVINNIYIIIISSYDLHLQKTFYSFKINEEKINLDKLINSIVVHNRIDILTLYIQRYIYSYDLKLICYYISLEESILQNNELFKRTSIEYLKRFELQDSTSMDQVWSYYMSASLFIEMVNALSEIHNDNSYVILISINKYYNCYNLGLYKSPSWFTDKRARQVYDQLFQKSALNFHKEYCDYKIQQKHDEAVRYMLPLFLEYKLPRDIINFVIAKYV